MFGFLFFFFFNMHGYKNQSTGMNHSCLIFTSLYYGDSDSYLNFKIIETQPILKWPLILLLPHLYSVK